MRRRVVICSATGALVAAVLVVPGAAADPVPAVTSTLAKSVVGVSAPADHGATATWVVGYDNNGTGVGSATITDAVGAGQSYVTGSLDVPPGWTPSWSADGSTFQGAEPPSGVVAVRAENPVTAPDETSLSGLLTPPVQASTTATGGDGFTPLLHRTPTGALQSWNIYHHAAPTVPKVVCVDLASGQPCAGGPWPQPLNTTSGPLGSGATGDISSPMAHQYFRDPAAPSQVLYTAATTSSVGVGCLDLATAANCGYWPLSTPGGISGANNTAGFVEVGGNLYGLAGSGAVLCWTVATRAACPGQPYAPIVPPSGDQPGNPWFYGAMTVVAGKVFASSSRPNTGSQAAMGCFDPATESACAGWASPRPVGAPGNYTYNAYTAYSTTGAQVGACSTTTGSSPGVTTCYALDGSALPAPSSAVGLPGGVIAFNPEVITDPDGHVRSYLAIWGGPYAGAAICHDWTTASACAGLPDPITHPTVNGGVTRDYGYTYDVPTGCMIGLGDAGVLFSMDPLTGASPCVRSGGRVSLTPGDFYCDGASGHVQGYGSARLVGVTPGNVDFGASRVTVVDQDGATVATPGFAPDGTVDLSGVSPIAHPTISVTTTLVLNSGADFGGGSRPRLAVDFTGDPPQVCFRTTIATDCAVADVSNTATGTDTTGAFTSNTVTVPVAPGPACRPVVTADKEICASKTASHCGPNGSGPWAEKAAVGTLGLLNATAYWRITVTNQGPVAITDARVVDYVEPSCETAAGTFTLQPGETKRFHCSTYALLTLFPLTNEAKASYTPRNSPAGTPPSYSAWSSATACSLLCLLG
ncbi:DUF7617 domain-containing protein [Saccharothrix yanglingensis]|uniref:DUF7617 domain-containing protein n=1 Tax=Saccharothrix yanglingensis TaxID=659496 RepID=A0ABU0WZL1_9PSEU|nr:hypothetical protein [Saccharothrix yanglingensis]MDQ2585246.1 hypothetical protein [Saccharothrix yanglingensis]